MENKKVEEMSFEESYKELEETLNAMEKTDVTLEESIKLFKRGVELYKRCKFLIDSASLSVKEVLGNLEKEMEIGEDDMGR
jgi:exodeoxyribonuclease VII small subunit